ncbi:MAG TPA: hypothetical protein VGO59_04115 [Verrucomicrobiae bacterium]|jgi:hypothetical protein
MKISNKNELTKKMPNGVLKAHHDFMKDVLCNDDASTDAEIQEFLVSEGVEPGHAAQYIRNRTRYRLEFGFKDDGTPRFPAQERSRQRRIVAIAGTILLTRRVFVSHQPPMFFHKPSPAGRKIGALSGHGYYQLIKQQQCIIYIS